MHTVTVNKALLELFRQRAILHAWEGERWQVGHRIAFEAGCRLEPYCEILEGHFLPRAFGAFSYTIGPLEPQVEVGRYCSIARFQQWMGADHPVDWASSSPVFHQSVMPAAELFRAAYGVTEAPEPFPGLDRTVRIGHDVWIGDAAMIAPGVRIGDGAVVGARALVLEDVPPYAIVVGHPARVLRYRFPEPLIARFQALQWWRFAPDSLQSLPASDPERFLDGLEAKLAVGAARAMQPSPLTAADMLRAAAA
jgi:acetyltransferase-like isoleucine patch superfamily enzyme